MIVDVVCTERHYIDHAAPVWAELDPDERGYVTVSDHLHTYAATRGLVSSKPSPTGDVLFAVGWSDITGWPSYRSRVLAEHGVGQAYDGGSKHYVGGAGREAIVDLFVLPNHVSATHQHGNVEVVGSVLLDEIDAASFVREPSVDATFSFHWDCDHLPETTSAWRWARDEVVAIARRRPVFVSAHPRLEDEAREWFTPRTVATTRRMTSAIRWSKCWVADNTSSMFYAAALGCPVVVLNPPAYRRDIAYGMRFWEWASVGVQCNDPAALDNCVALAIEDPSGLREARERVIAEVFPMRDGLAARRTVEAIRRLP